MHATADTLLQHTKQAAYQASVWATSEMHNKEALYTRILWLGLG